MGNFRVGISDPSLIVQGAIGDQAWGHYQFPTLTRARDGGILASWSYGNDSMEGGSHEGGKKPPYISYDEGQTWQHAGTDRVPEPKWKMPDGKYFCGFVSRGGHAMSEEWWGRYRHYAEWDNAWESGFRMYFAEDLEKNDDTVVKATIYDPITGETEVYEPVINWPNAPIVCYPGFRIYPMTQMFALSNSGIFQHDGVLYICLYFNGFHSFAKNREEAVDSHCKYYSIYVFRSRDNARTWDQISQIPTTDEYVTEDRSFEGFCEPMMSRMPDGSFVMLLRTGNVSPSYLTRSEDGCRTWSAPVRFDDCGVFPQIITLGCGVTLAGYGRPVLKLRVTEDRSGLVWEEPKEIELVNAGWKQYLEDHIDASCFYTNFLPLDDYNALWIYTEFWHPDGNGNRAKAVLVRKITVSPNED